MESGRVIANGDRGHAEVFLDHLKRRLVSTGQQQALLYEQPDFGSRPDYRIAQIGGDPEHDAEEVVARLFVPPMEVTEIPDLPARDLRGACSEVIVTGRELHIFTGDEDGYRQLCGHKASWAHGRRFRTLWISSGMRCSIQSQSGCWVVSCCGCGFPAICAGRPRSFCVSPAGTSVGPRARSLLQDGS